MRARIAIACVVLALASVACTRTLDTKGLEDQIVAMLKERGGPAVTDVSCPSDVKVEVGATFECTATDANGTTWQLKLTQKDDRGTVTIEIAGTES